MVHKDEFVTAMTEVLELMNRVAVFYAKYHILEFQERCDLAHQLRERHREWVHCHAFEQQHVDFIVVLTRELRMHYDEWIQDQYVRHKRWRKHPGVELDRLLSESVNVLAHMEAAIIHNTRRLSGVAPKTEAWA